MSTLQKRHAYLLAVHSHTEFGLHSPDAVDVSRYLEGHDMTHEAMSLNLVS